MDRPAQRDGSREVKWLDALFHFFLEAFGTGVPVLLLLVPVGVASSLLCRFLR